MNVDVTVELEIILSVFEMPTWVISRRMRTNVLEVCSPESAIAQMGERRSSVLLSELHTNWVRVRASPASMYFHTGWCINLA